MSSPDSLLAQGIAASRAGDTGTARRLLAEAVRQNPDSDRAWLWLGAVLTTPQGRAFCLRRALALNPAQPKVRQGLDALENAPRAPVLVARPAAVAPVLPVANLPERAKSEPTKSPPSTFSRVAK